MKTKWNELPCPATLADVRWCSKEECWVFSECKINAGFVAAYILESADKITTAFCCPKGRRMQHLRFENFAARAMPGAKQLMESVCAVAYVSRFSRPTEHHVPLSAGGKDAALHSQQQQKGQTHKSTFWTILQIYCFPACCGKCNTCHIYGRKLGSVLIHNFPHECPPRAHIIHRMLRKVISLGW